MKFETPTFKKKTASIIWMLMLSLALVLVDYFLSPVATENGWLFEKVEKSNRRLLNTTQCKEKIQSYQLKHNDSKYAAQGCLSNGNIIFVRESNYKGEIFINHQNKSGRIAVNLQLPKMLAINSDDEVFIWEQGRQRVIKFWKK